MAEIYCPFESLNTGTVSEPVYDRAITAEMERSFNKLRYTNGVFSSVGSGLAVSAANNMTVTVGTGGAHIEGAMYVNTAPLSLTVEAANASLNRIDRVVLQFNTSVSVRSVRALIRTGTAATNPVAPELRQESNLYEIALADVYVKKGATSIAASAITDQRLNSALCGFVVAAIPSSVDTTGLFDQYQAALNEWLDTVAAALDETLAGNLQNQITALGTRLTAEESKVQPITKGGTGETTRASAMSYLGYIQAKELSFLTGNGDGDTTVNWAKAGAGMAYISAEGLLKNQPRKYGWLLNYTIGSALVAQQFIGLDGNSPVWYRSGNSSGWYAGSEGWVKSLDEKTTGTFYEQHFNSVAVPASTSKAVASLTLPAGTYVVEGGSSWATDNRNMFIMAFIRNVTANQDIALNRGVMIAGGGLMPTAVVKLDKESTITMYVYWSGGSGTATHNSDYLRAVKIK